MEENIQEEVQEAEPVKAEAVSEVAVSDEEDIEKNKGMAILAYFVFFIPMLTDAKDSKFAMFHANQSLILVIAGVVVSIVGAIIPVLGWLIILPVGLLAVAVFWIIGIINAANGKMKELPLIGGINILNKQ
jgi:uncharacterized membrane protein